MSRTTRTTRSTQAERPLPERSHLTPALPGNVLPEEGALEAFTDLLVAALSDARYHATVRVLS